MKVLSLILLLIESVLSGSVMGIVNRVSLCPVEHLLALWQVDDFGDLLHILYHLQISS